MTVGELMERMSMDEFRDWQAFFAWEAETEKQARHQSRAQALSVRAARGIR